MTVAIGLDPAFTTAASGAAVTSAAFAPTDGSLIVVVACADSGTTGITCTLTNNKSVTFTPIGTTQVGSSGGAVALYWGRNDTGATLAGMTVTATWSGTGTTGGKAVKPTTYTGCHTTAPIGAKSQGTSGTNNLSVSFTNTVDGSLGFGGGVEWNALGLPTSTDTETGFHLSSQIDGISVYKAATTTGTGQTVTLNMDAGGTGAALWSYNICEILPLPSGNVSANAENAASTAAADNAAALVGGQSEGPAVTGAADNAVALVSGQAGAPAGTGQANDAAVTASGNAAAESAAGTGQADNAVALVSGQDVGAGGTGTANDVGTGVFAFAECAVGAGVANDATVNAGSNTQAAAENAVGVSAAGDPLASSAVVADVATGTGAADNAAPAVGGQDASGAAAAGAAGDPSTAVRAVDASGAAGVAAADNAAGGAGGQAGVPVGTGGADDAAAWLRGLADYASGAGLANDVSGSGSSGRNAPAECATGVGEAFPAFIGREQSGVYVMSGRPGAGYATGALVAAYATGTAEALHTTGGTP